MNTATAQKKSRYLYSFFVGILYHWNWPCWAVDSANGWNRRSSLEPVQMKQKRKNTRNVNLVQRDIYQIRYQTAAAKCSSKMKNFEWWRRQKRLFLFDRLLKPNERNAHKHTAEKQRVHSMYKLILAWIRVYFRWLCYHSVHVRCAEVHITQLHNKFDVTDIT